MVTYQRTHIPGFLDNFHNSCTNIISDRFTILQRQIVDINYDTGPLNFSKLMKKKNGEGLVIEYIKLDRPNQRFDNSTHDYIETFKVLNKEAPSRSLKMKNMYLNGQKISKVRYIHFPWGQFVKYKIEIKHIFPFNSVTLTFNEQW